MRSFMAVRQKKPLTFGDERPILPYPPERMVGVWTIRGGGSINCMIKTHIHQAMRYVIVLMNV